jgi:orotate phosphoribosyltransferase
MYEVLRQRLLQLFRLRGVSLDRSPLVSAQERKYFLNSQGVLLYSEALVLLGEILWEQTRDLNLQAIGGVGTEAIPMIVAAVSHYQREGRKLEGFFIREQVKDHGSQKLIEGILPSGARVAIVTEILTVGEDVVRAILEVERAGAEVVTVICLLDCLEEAPEQRNPTASRYLYHPIFTTHDFRF